MFKRDHHVRIATVLQSLNSKFLLEKGCYFGGGTAIVLVRDEYRESVDMDFLISNIDGYRQLRQSIKESNSLTPITLSHQTLKLSRDIRADQYGIRTMIDIGGVEIKFEIVFEARVSFEKPSLSDNVCGVSTLSAVDMATSKLLANSDRWPDDSVFSRDIIDLAMLELPSAKLKAAVIKATAAYGDSIQKDLKNAIENLKNRSDRLSECMTYLKIDNIPQAVLWERIRALKKHCDFT